MWLHNPVKVTDGIVTTFHTKTTVIAVKDKKKIGWN
jgi:hypothetical protein